MFYSFNFEEYERSILRKMWCSIRENGQMKLHLIELIKTYPIVSRDQVIESINQEDGYQILIENQDGVAILWTVIAEAGYKKRITESEYLEYASLLAYKYSSFLEKENQKNLFEKLQELKSGIGRRISEFLPWRKRNS
jgi:hypothetical protein